MEWPVGLNSSTNCINVDNLPLLTADVPLAFSLNLLSFSILASNNINSLSVIEIDEMMSHESELLPPSVGGRPNSDFVESGSCFVVNHIDRFGDMLNRLNSLGITIEVPFLGVLSVW